MSPPPPIRTVALKLAQDWHCINREAKESLRVVYPLTTKDVVRGFSIPLPNGQEERVHLRQFGFLGIGYLFYYSEKTNTAFIDYT